MESTIAFSVSIFELSIIIEFSIDAFFMVQLLPILVYGPINVLSCITVLSPMIAGPLIRESYDKTTFSPIATFPFILALSSMFLPLSSMSIFAASISSTVPVSFHPPSNYVLTGIYFFTPLIFDYIKKLKPSWRNEYEITEAIQLLLKDNKNIGYDIIDGWWKDTGTVDDILAANMLILDRGKNIEERANVKGKVAIGKNVVLSDDSLIRGPAIIGDNTVIQDKTFIGPYTSIGDNCTIKKASIENSIIMDNSNIDTENTIVDSIIGENSVIMNANLLKPAGKRLLLGENSRIYI